MTSDLIDSLCYSIVPGTPSQSCKLSRESFHNIKLAKSRYYQINNRKYTMGQGLSSVQFYAFGKKHFTEYVHDKANDCLRHDIRI